jgi:dihydroorotate dehydrogenase electron transfer subunit
MPTQAKPEPRRGVYTATVTSNVAVCQDHFLLRLEVENFPPSRPGQFIQLQCRDVFPQTSGAQVDWPENAMPKLTQPELADREPLLRRPLSLAGRKDTPGGATELLVIYRSFGTGTRWLSGIEAGRELSVLGPLGNAFAIRPEKPFAALVGGGVGIPPMIYLSEHLAAAEKKSVAFCGARSRTLLPLTILLHEPSADGEPGQCVAEFAASGVDASVATDDGAVGYRGLVSEIFHRWLNHLDAKPEQIVVYSCGPERMMRAVADICIAAGVECQLALERHMACGMGTCQSCVVKIRTDAPAGWSYKLCCTDGPVFDAKNVLW